MNYDPEIISKKEFSELESTQKMETVTEYLTRLILRDYPEIAEKLRQGEFDSLEEAAFSAGIITKQNAINNHLELLLQIWKKSGPPIRSLFLTLAQDELNIAVPTAAKLVSFGKKEEGKGKDHSFGDFDPGDEKKAKAGEFGDFDPGDTADKENEFGDFDAGKTGIIEDDFGDFDAGKADSEAETKFGEFDAGSSGGDDEIDFGAFDPEEEDDEDTITIDFDEDLPEDPNMPLEEKVDEFGEVIIDEAGEEIEEEGFVSLDKLPVAEQLVGSSEVVPAPGLQPIMPLPPPKPPQQMPGGQKRWKALEDQLNQVAKLPSLQDIFLKILAASNSEERDIDSLYRILVPDQAMSAKIIQLANSDHYDLGNEVKTFRMALVVLGYEEICQLSGNIAVLNIYPKLLFGGDFDYGRFWQHSVSVAMCSKTIISKFNSALSEELYYCGILHDIGKPYLAYHFPHEIKKCEDYALANGYPFWRAELEMNGTNHARVGAFLAQTWKLSPLFTDAVRWHHEVWKAKASRIEVAVIHLANSICQLKPDGGITGITTEAMQNHPAWKILASSFPSLQVDVGQLIDEFNWEVDKAQKFMRHIQSVM